mmetsp:Transcript_15507/g.32171  ORF Transcript_15507/g.32171 Transcript_15507/m.32171 type:complete len:100 (-) Transcript_15507:125-424(-)
MINSLIFICRFYVVTGTSQNLNTHVITNPASIVIPFRITNSAALIVIPFFHIHIILHVSKGGLVPEPSSRLLQIKSSQRKLSKISGVAREKLPKSVERF